MARCLPLEFPFEGFGHRVVVVEVVLQLPVHRPAFARLSVQRGRFRFGFPGQERRQDRRLARLSSGLRLVDTLEEVGLFRLGSAALLSSQLGLLQLFYDPAGHMVFFRLVVLCEVVAL